MEIMTQTGMLLSSRKGPFWPTRIPQFGVKNELTVKNLLTVGKPVTLIREVENLTSMSKPVEECRGKDGIGDIESYELVKKEYRGIKK